MPAATHKAELIERTKADYAKLKSLIDEIPADRALRKNADGISIKDIIGHRAHWIDLFLTWYEDGQNGLDVHMPAKGYKWSELARYNAELRRAQAALSWEEAKSYLHDRYTTLITLLEICREDALYVYPMIGGNFKWTTGRYAEAAGASHFRSALKFIRAELQALETA